MLLIHHFDHHFDLHLGPIAITKTPRPIIIGFRAGTLDLTKPVEDTLYCLDKDEQSPV